MMMVDIKTLKEQVKAELDRETVAMILSFIEQEITRDYHFADDPSFSIARDGYIKDFGSTGFAGDIFDFLMWRDNMSFVESVKYVADCLGVRYE